MNVLTEKKITPPAVLPAASLAWQKHKNNPVLAINYYAAFIWKRSLGL